MQMRDVLAKANRTSAWKCALATASLLYLGADASAQGSLFPDRSPDAHCAERPSVTSRRTTIYFSARDQIGRTREEVRTFFSRLGLGVREPVVFRFVDARTNSATELLSTCYPGLTSGELGADVTAPNDASDTWFSPIYRWIKRNLDDDPQEKIQDMRELLQQRLMSKADEAKVPDGTDGGPDLIQVILAEASRLRVQGAFDRLLFFGPAASATFQAAAVGSSAFASQAVLDKVLRNGMPSLQGKEALFVFGKQQPSNIGEVRRMWHALFQALGGRVVFFGAELETVKARPTFAKARTYEGTWKSSISSGRARGTIISDEQGNLAASWVWLMAPQVTWAIALQGTFRCANERCELLANVAEGYPELAEKKQFEAGKQEVRLEGEVQKLNGAIEYGPGVFFEGAKEKEPARYQLELRETSSVTNR